MKKIFLIISLLWTNIVFVQELKYEPYQNNDIMESFMKLSTQQMFDTAKYYFNKNSFDTSLICFKIFINNATIEETDIELQKKVIIAYNYTAVIHSYFCDYGVGYHYFIMALFLAEKINYDSLNANIINNIGTTYAKFKKFDMAKFYYRIALDLPQDSSNYINLLINLGELEIRNNNYDSAFYYHNNALQISRRNNNKRLHFILNNIAMTFQKTENYDSAYFYYHLSLTETKKNNDIRYEGEVLSNLGILYFENNRLDSSLYYTNLSNIIAKENDFFDTMVENYLILSKIEESKGNTVLAFELYKKYANLRDSVFNAAKLGDINQLQHYYEVSKINQQIEQFYVEKQINELTIHYQKFILQIIITTLLLMCIVLIVFLLQNKKLRKAYKILVDKNVKIIELHKKTIEKYKLIIGDEEEKKDKNDEEGKEKVKSIIKITSENTISTFNSEKQPSTSELKVEKSKNSILSKKSQKMLLEKILFFMENSSEIYNPEFTMVNLADLIHSNQTYISIVINNVLKTNFRSFLNEYRVREAQRLFSETNISKYNVEFVANRVGFKSRNSFTDTFKEITGVTPAFYVKSFRENLRREKRK